MGWLAILVTAIFGLHVSSFAPPHKSDMRDVAGELAPLLHRGDLVISGQPEQVSLAWYYLPSGLRYANTLGPVSDPTHMNWVDALTKLQDATPQTTLAPLLASLRPGQQVLFVRPITRFVSDWTAPWTRLVRRRSAQWGAVLASDPRLKPIAWAPHYYHPAYAVADSAVLYRVS